MLKHPGFVSLKLWIRVAEKLRIRIGASLYQAAEKLEFRAVQRLKTRLIIRPYGMPEGVADTNPGNDSHQGIAFSDAVSAIESVSALAAEKCR